MEFGVYGGIWGSSVGFPWNFGGSGGISRSLVGFRASFLEFPGSFLGFLGGSRRFWWEFWEFWWDFGICPLGLMSQLLLCLSFPQLLPNPRTSKQDFGIFSIIPKKLGCP